MLAAADSRHLEGHVQVVVAELADDALLLGRVSLRGLGEHGHQVLGLPRAAEAHRAVPDQVLLFLVRLGALVAGVKHLLLLVLLCLVVRVVRADVLALRGLRLLLLFLLGDGGGSCACTAFPTSLRRLRRDSLRWGRRLCLGLRLGFGARRRFLFLLFFH